MDLRASAKFCPICKNKNLMTATICAYCGALLQENLGDSGATTKNTNEPLSAPVENFGTYVDVALIPEGGIGVYVGGSLKPYYLSLNSDLTVGRKPEDAMESFLDLSDLDGFNLGVSRRHACIRRMGAQFEVIDLSSTNGTWLNNERLSPNKPYPFSSGSQFRFGRMRLFIIYRPSNRT